ncbi:hypothetical protein INR49_021313 [Caranx melampygus]|nr:hypothetical protein INR49_021313 [Caranx melampygus]
MVMYLPFFAFQKMEEAHCQKETENVKVCTGPQLKHRTYSEPLPSSHVALICMRCHTHCDSGWRRATNIFFKGKANFVPRKLGLALDQSHQRTTRSWRAVQADRDTERQGLESWFLRKS